VKTATLFRKSGKSVTQCTACSWYCRITPGNVGVCGTRLNKNGILYSLVYGKATGLAVDPVEKKPLNHFLPGSSILSFGTAGCNFGCEFCQNAWMSQITKFKIKSEKLKVNIDEIIKRINSLSTEFTSEEIVEEALRTGCRGIAYTYNEPAIFIEYARDTARLAKKKGLANIFVSNGFESAETFEYIKSYLDAINIDLKSFRNDFYRKICHAKIAPVLENIKRYFEAGIETEVTTLIIPGHNDTDEELTDIADFLVSVSPDIPWHISAFRPEYKMPDVPETPAETLMNAYRIGKKAGLHYIYVGNILDPRHSSTYCPVCSELLIERIYYDTGIKNIDINTGKCKKCGEKIYGVWN
jgi:pyruvate formate lyase activating enzyme